MLKKIVFHTIFLKRSQRSHPHFTLSYVKGPQDIDTYLTESYTFKQPGTGGENWKCTTRNVTGPPGALSFDVKPEIAQEKSL